MSYGPRRTRPISLPGCTTSPVSSAISRTSAAASSSPCSTRPPGSDHSPRAGSLARRTSSRRPSVSYASAPTQATVSSPSVIISAPPGPRVGYRRSRSYGTNHGVGVPPHTQNGGRGERQEDRWAARARVAHLLRDHATYGCGWIAAEHRYHAAWMGRIRHHLLH